MSRCARPFSTLGKALPRNLYSPGPSPIAAPSSRRAYAVQTPGAPRFQVFNKRTKWLQKERAAANAEQGRQTDYLKDEVAVRLSERLLVSLRRCLHSHSY